MLSRIKSLLVANRGEIAIRVMRAANELGIRHVGTQTAIDLAAKFRSLEALAEAKIDELAEVEGGGEVVAESVAEWFSEPHNQKLLDKFKDRGVKDSAGYSAGRDFGERVNLARQVGKAATGNNPRLK